MSSTLSQHVLSTVNDNDHSDNVDLESRVPSVILIGSGKCGSGALMTFLNMHPSLVIKGGEMIYFSKDYDKGYEWYRQQMPVSSPDQITIAKSAGYLYKDYVPERIYSFNASTKLLLIIRDPVPRSTSAYAQKCAEAQLTNSSIGTFEDMILLNGTGDINKKAAPISTGMYANFIPMWLKQFPRNQLLILDGDMLIKDPYVELHKVELYLGISSYFTREMFVYDQEKGFFCPIQKDGQKKCLGKGKGRKHVEMSEDLKNKVMRCFRPSNKQLKNVTGQTFSWVSKY